MGGQSVWHASSLPWSHYMGRLGNQVWYKGEVGTAPFGGHV